MQRTWQFDPSYTTLEFSVTRLWFFTVKGSFEHVEGVITTDDPELAQTSVTTHIKTTSLKTGSKRHDAQLLSAAFLDASSFPEIEFSSTRVSRGTDRDMFDVAGTLKIKGQTKEILLTVNEMDRSRSPGGEEFVYYSATTEFDRHALGLTGMPELGHQLKVTINVQAILQ